MKHAVCVLIVDDNGEVLCVSRKDDLMDWGLPGGKLDDGEMSVVGAIRETAEETGHKIVIDNIDEYFIGRCGDYNVITYRASIVEYDFIKISQKETGAVAFLDPSYLLNGSFRKYNEYCLSFFNVKTKEVYDETD